MHPDFLIIGGGAVGLATALELARRGARVRIVDRQAFGQESSWAGAGILSTLLPWHYGAAVNALANYSLGLYPAWIDHLCGQCQTDPEYLTSGMLVLPSTSNDLPADRHAPPAAVCQGLSDAGQGHWMPEVAQARNPRLVAAMLEACRHEGVELWPDCAIESIEYTDHQVTQVRSTCGELSAGGFILCAGAWTGQLAASTGSRPDIRPVRGQMLLYRIPPGRLSAIVYQNGRYLVPRKDGHLLVGSTLEDVGFDKTTTPAGLALLSQWAASLLPELAGQTPLRHWAGLRPGSPGNLPTIARDATLENLYFNSGHFRYGVTMAPGSARLLADRILSPEAAGLPAEAYVASASVTNAEMKNAGASRPAQHNAALI